MGTQRLGEKWLRKAECITGLRPLFGCSHGGYTMNFTTADHTHFWIDKVSEEWEVFEPKHHYSTCRLLWPSGYPARKEPIVSVDLDALAKKIRNHDPLDTDEVRAVTEGVKKVADALAERLRGDVRVITFYMETVIGPQLQAAARSAVQLYESLPEESRQRLLAQYVKKAE